MRTTYQLARRSHSDRDDEHVHMCTATCTSSAYIITTVALEHLTQLKRAVRALGDALFKPQSMHWFSSDFSFFVSLF